MNPKLAPVRTFGRGSPVLDYWLLHSEGFALTTPGGGRLGVVEEVVVDEQGYPRALIVRRGVLQRPHVMNVRAVEAVVPADGRITLGRSRRRGTWPGIALRRSDPGRRPTALPRRASTKTARRTRLEHASAKAARHTRRTGLLARAHVVSTVGSTARRLRTDVPLLARWVGRASVSAAAWVRPLAGTAARLAGSAAVAAGLVALALAYGLVVAVVSIAGVVARTWARLRSAGAPGRMTPFS